MQSGSVGYIYMQLEMEPSYRILATLKKFCEKENPFCCEPEQGQDLAGPTKDNTTTTTIGHQLELFESLLLQGC